MDTKELRLQGWSLELLKMFGQGVKMLELSCRRCWIKEGSQIPGLLVLTLYVVESLKRKKERNIKGQHMRRVETVVYLE